MSEPITREQLVEFLRLIVEAIPNTSWDNAVQWNRIAYEKLFEYIGDEVLRDEFKRAAEARDSDASRNIFNEIFDRLDDAELQDLFLELARVVYEYPQSRGN